MSSRNNETSGFEVNSAYNESVKTAADQILCGAHPNLNSDEAIVSRRGWRSGDTFYLINGKRPRRAIYDLSARLRYDRPDSVYVPSHQVRLFRVTPQEDHTSEVQIYDYKYWKLQTAKMVLSQEQAAEIALPTIDETYRDELDLHFSLGDQQPEALAYMDFLADLNTFDSENLVAL